MWDGLEPVNYHSLSDFRVGHQAGLDELFTQVLGVLHAEGLLTLQRVMSKGNLRAPTRGPGSVVRRTSIPPSLLLAN
jgi:hypothetical protein